ncbi:metallophosphoesterase [Nitrospirota bacterium]
MLIGVISDSHDDMEQISKAVTLINQRKATHVIHAGDLVSPFTFEVLGGLDCPFTGIFGNNDGDHVLLKEKSEGRLFIQPHMIELNGRFIAIVHEPIAVEALALSGKYDVVIHGHTHIPYTKKEERALVINPGKLARLHKGKSTMVFLDLAALEAEIVEL